MSMPWREAIIEVMRSANEPLHPSDIASEVSERRLRAAEDLGATPSATVSSYITNSLNQDGEKSPFVRVARGIYSLREIATPAGITAQQQAESVTPQAGIIHALGMFWLRSKVSWKSETRLFGRQQQDSQPVDFAKQIGVYFLHDTQGVVYVGRAIDQPIGKRLQQHTIDRLNGRWDRFSWFGIYPVNNNGTLETSVDLSGITVDTVVATLEAVLIEGLEPRQNRKRGDDFKAIEFLQSDDPDIVRSRNQALLNTLAAQLNLAEH